MAYICALSKVTSTYIYVYVMIPIFDYTCIKLVFFEPGERGYTSDDLI